MKPHRDKRWYVLYGHCFNCQVDIEHNLRKEGKLEEVEQQITNDHVDGMTKDFEVWFKWVIKYQRFFCHWTRRCRKWDGSGKAQLLKYKEEA